MVNYQISAKENVQVQGIDVTLSTLFDDGTMPKKVEAKGQGHLQAQHQQDKMQGVNMYLSFGALYNTEKELFENWNGQNIPADFQNEVLEKIKEFYNKIKTDKA